MADQNTFPNSELENENKKIEKKILDINAIIKKRLEENKNKSNAVDINSLIDERLKKNTSNTESSDINKKISERLDIDVETLGKTNDIISKEDRDYVNTLGEKENKKVLLYLDIFRDNPEIVTDYLQTIKKWGSEKAAKEAGSNSVLLYPKKIKKLLEENPEQFSEDSAKRFSFYNDLGEHLYNIQIREDREGRKYQKEWLGKKWTKAGLATTEAVGDSVRGLSLTIAGLIDKVGPENAASAVDWIEANWPKADDIKYPNKLSPFAQESLFSDLVQGLAQFGIDVYLGGRVLKAFKWSIGKVAPGWFKETTKQLSKKKPRLDKAGKEIADEFGNVKFASSIAQKMGFWGLPVKYGIGQALTDDTPQDMLITEAGTQALHQFGLTKENLIPLKDKEWYEKLTKKEKASYILKRKLLHGVEGVALFAGLTKAIPIAGKGIWGTTKWVGRGLSTPASVVMNPISKIMASRKTGLPQVVKGIRNAGGFIGGKVLKIPPYKNWGFFSTTMGPWRERFFASIEEKILPSLRVRGPWTKEASQILQQGEQMVRRFKKEVGLSISQIDRAIYGLMNRGFANRIMTTSSAMSGKQYWDDVIRYLRGEIKLDALPAVLRGGAQDIQKLIEKLSQRIKPFVKNQEIKKEIIDGMGKYVTTSYRIFQGTFKPNKGEIEAAQKYFVDLIKKTDPAFKNVRVGSNKWSLLNRLASQKVDDILQYGKEGSSPIGRLNEIKKLVSPDGILKPKQQLPKVIEDLMGKVNDGPAIIMDTVAAQAELLSHLFVHKSILREGLKSGWIVTDPKKFAMEGVQKWVAKSLVPISQIARTSNIDIAKIYAHKGGNYYTTTAIANAIRTDALASDAVLQWWWYQPFLAAKTASQLSKTVLSLMTQSRNFETAMFFSIMQGHVGPQASVMEAMKFVFGDVVGSGKVNANAMRKKLTEWTEVGILDTSIVAGEMEAVIGDIVKGRFANTGQLFKYLLKNPIFRKATEFYQGSDSVWKAYGYEFTKSQLLAAIPIRGLSVESAKRLGYVVEKGRTIPYNWKDLVSNQMKEIFGMKWNPLRIDGSEKTYGDALKEIAGKYIKDVYPNYNIVPTLVKNWRRFPFGNFIAFRSENIRNTFNTMAYAMREMSSSNPFLRQMGAKRMMGLSATFYGLEKGLSLFTSALTNLDEEWMGKYKRWFVPYYDKTSTLFAVSKPDKDFKFWSLNWTRENPYEGMQDAFEVMTKELFNPVNDDWSMGKRFYNAFFYNIEEDTPGSIYLLFEPFITPGLFFKAVVDIAPAAWTGGIGKNGITETGAVVYDIRNDSPGEILAKIYAHVWADLEPTTAKNVGEVIAAGEGELTKSGKEINTLNKLFKTVLGIGLEKQDPKGSITYVISGFTKRITATHTDFIREATNINQLLLDPFLFTKKFEELQENRYREYSRLYDFVKFLRDDLKMTNAEIWAQVKNRKGFSRRTLNMMYQGVFDPANIPSLDYTSIFPSILKRINNTDLYKNNPLTLRDIYDVEKANSIKRKWMRVPLQLSESELQEYFITGKDPREKDEEKKVEEKELTLTPKDEKKLPPSGDEKEPAWKRAIKIFPGKQSNLPVKTTDVSDQVLQASTKPVNVDQKTGLTRVEDALLSNEEKAIKLRNKGVRV